MNRDCLDLKDELSVARAISIPNNVLDQIIQNIDSHYYSFQRPKKDGKTPRTITPPRKLLMTVQKRIKRFIENRTHHWSSSVHGGIRGRSVITNAAPHVGKEMVVNLDIASFFPSTSKEQVIEALQRCGCSLRSANYLAKLVTLNNQLPQGAPTSMLLGNLVLEPLDSEFKAISRRNNLDYSRYVDDLTISGNADLNPFRGAFSDIIHRHKYDISPKKFIFTGRNKPQMVTGIQVNSTMRPSTEFIRDLSDTIKDCWPEASGPAIVAAEMNKTLVGLKNSLFGKINFVRSVNKKIGNGLRGLMVKIQWSPVFPLSHV